MNRKVTVQFLKTTFGFGKPITWQQRLLIVAVHATGWILFFFLPFLFYPVQIDESLFWLKEVINKVFLIALFYTNYFLFLPRFFEKREFKNYSLAVLAGFLFLFAQQLAFERYTLQRPYNVTQQNNMAPAVELPQTKPTVSSPFSPTRVSKPFPPVQEQGFFGLPKTVAVFLFYTSLSAYLFLLLIGGCIRLAFSFVQHEEEKKAIENAKLQAEVQFLKSQINPHFLFNSLNSIYVQAHQQSAQTQASILKLSEILRYVLYDSSAERIALQKDLAYIQNYLELQRLRLSEKVRIDYDVTGSTEGLLVAPLLLMTFIENAFKHGISYAKPSVVRVYINVQGEILSMRVENPVVQQSVDKTDNGIGLVNTQRRLELLYPGKYNLDVAQTDNAYVVHLKLHLA